METKILFEEVQSFGKTVIQNILKVIIGLLIAGSILSLFLTPENQPEISTAFLAGILICGIMSFALTKTRLITQVREDGIYVRFPPLQNKFTICSWEKIDSVFLRNYSPVGEFGGWGIRLSPNGKAYNVSGNIGLQIIFKNGNKFLIGTQDKEKLSAVLSQIGHLNY